MQAQQGVTVAPVHLRNGISLRHVASFFPLGRVLIVHGPFDVVHARSSEAGGLVRFALFFPKAVFYSPRAVLTSNPGLRRIKRIFYSFSFVEFIFGRFSSGYVLACSKEEIAELD